MRKNLFYIAILLFLVSAAACSGQAAGAGTGAKEKEAVSGGSKEGRAGDGGEKEAGSDVGQASSDADTGVAREDQLSALDTVIVINVNTDERAVILQNAQSGSRYELSYDGRTQFFDRFGSAISAAQVEAGTIADVRLSVHSGYLKSLNISDNTFCLRSVKDYAINENKGMFSTGGSNYRLPARLPVIYGASVGDIKDICDGDVLTLYGMDRTVMTCVVEQGHGYLKIKGQQPFVGGWIEIGKLLLPVSEDMLLTVPEGERDLKISYKGRGGSVKVRVERDRETTVDVSSLKDEIVQTGTVSFKIRPSVAKLEINGRETDYLLPVELEYGSYRVRVSYEGYVPWEKSIRVAKKEGELSIELEREEIEEEEEDKSTSASSSGNLRYVVPSASSSAAVSGASSTAAGGLPLPASLLGSSTAGNTSSSAAAFSQEGEYFDEEDDDDDDDDDDGEYPYLFINEPYDCEVYYDGSYKGVSPLGIKKETGTHVITLHKDGHVTKSYTLTIGEGDEDESFSFPELAQE